MAHAEYKETPEVRMGLDFGFKGDDIPKYWMAGDPFRTRMMDAVQATFPDGERYFITTVMAFKDQIEDPALKAEVKDFAMQEGQHGRVHTEFNERLQRQGLDIKRVTGMIMKLNNRRLKYFSAQYNIALTAAFEHLTAMMAELFFAEKHVLAGADERVKAMFAWHAIEEMEHKAVAYDVMQKVAKVGYLRRTTAMTHGLLSFTLNTLIMPWFMLKSDGIGRRERLALYARGLAWMFGPRKGVFTRMVPALAKYYKPGFHPNQLPSVHNYDAWKDTYDESQDPMAASEAMYAAAH